MRAALDREVERHFRSGNGPEWTTINLGRRRLKFTLKVRQ